MDGWLGDDDDGDDAAETQHIGACLSDTSDRKLETLGWGPVTFPPSHLQWPPAGNARGGKAREISW